MTYLCVDTDGDIIQYPAAPDEETMRSHLGIYGIARIRLPAVADLAAFVSNFCLIMPERYPRNPVGACLLACYGADLQPVGGPIVFTGWIFRPPQPSIQPLTMRRIDQLYDLHSSISAVVAGFASGHGGAWDDTVRRVAAQTVHTPTPRTLYPGERTPYDTPDHYYPPDTRRPPTTVDHPDSGGDGG